MNDLARQKLCEIVVQYGRSVCDDPRRVRGLLNDYCPGLKREVNLLVLAVEQRIAGDLLNSSAKLPSQAVSGRLVRRMTDDLGTAEEAARWTVETWAAALGVGVPTALPVSETSPEPVWEAAATLKASMPRTYTSATPGKPKEASWLKSVIVNLAVIGCLLLPLGAIILSHSFGWWGAGSQTPTTKANPEDQTPVGQMEVHSPNVTKSVPIAYDKESVRFMDDQLVIDLVLTNRTPFNLQDVKPELESPADNGRAEWKKQVELPWWPSGKEERVIVPLLNNDLDIEVREKDIGPPFEYSLSGSFQSAGIKRDVFATNQGPVRYSRFTTLRFSQQPGVPVQDTWKNCLTGGTSRRPNEATMSLKVKRASNEIPSLVQVQMLVVGYSETGELFRKRVARETWLESEEWSIEVPAGDTVRFRFRGVGKRRTTNADDLNKQQMYYICENWRMQSAK